MQPRGESRSLLLATKRFSLPLSTVLSRNQRRTPSRYALVVNWLAAQLSRETSSGRFIPEMDGLRFVAIAMVILFHLNGYLTAKTPLQVAGTHSTWVAQMAQVGFHGVELFFVISGFILGLPFAAHHLNGATPVSLRKYYLRRLTRLEPPFFVTALGLFVLAVWGQGRTAAALLPHLAASLFYLHNLIYGSASSVIGVAWSLEIEVQFYLLVPLLTLLFAIRRRWLRRLSVLGLILVTLSAQSLFVEQGGRASLSILGYLQFFLAGFLLADIFLADWKESPQPSVHWDIVSLLGWPLMFFILRSDVITHWTFVLLIFLLYSAAFRGHLGRRIFSNPWITAIGGMCYSIYLIHYEVISAVARFTDRIHPGGPYWVYFFIQLVLVGSAILLICGLYFVLLEKPCMRRDWWQRMWGYSPGEICSTGPLAQISAAE